MIDKHSSLERADLDDLVYDSVTVNVLADDELELRLQDQELPGDCQLQDAIGKENNKLRATVLNADYELQKI